ncbi:hypothetical protein [Amycolatopsis sp. NBC_01480]|nr:hypothetical protein [Amycolatopsis sp. NBC_01480]
MATSSASPAVIADEGAPPLTAWTPREKEAHRPRYFAGNAT